MVEFFEDDGKFFADEKSLNAYRAAVKRKRDELSHANYMRDLGIEEGRKLGIKQGRKLGIEEGKNEAIREIIKNMKKSNLNISLIKRITGWSDQDINAC